MVSSFPCPQSVFDIFFCKEISFDSHSFGVEMASVLPGVETASWLITGGNSPSTGCISRKCEKPRLGPEFSQLMAKWYRQDKELIQKPLGSFGLAPTWAGSGSPGSPGLRMLLVLLVLLVFGPCHRAMLNSMLNSRLNPWKPLCLQTKVGLPPPWIRSHGLREICRSAESDFDDLVNAENQDCKYTSGPTNINIIQGPSGT